MSDWSRFYNPIRNQIVLPPGRYGFTRPIEWQGVVITSQDPANPAVIDSAVLVYADQVHMTNLVFSAANVDGALVLRGLDAVVTNCRFHGNETAILAEKRCRIDRNVITHFKQDGIRFCGDNTVICNNVIGDMQPNPADPAHHDAIQGWGGNPTTGFRSGERYDAKWELHGAEIFGNTISDRAPSTLQGITIFDGLARDWRVANNQIHLHVPHGITIRGGINCRLTDNHLSGKAEAHVLPARRLLASGGWEDVQVS